MLSKKQISNVSILSVSIAALVAVTAPPAASTLLVFTTAFAISAMALSLITSIANRMTESDSNEFFSSPNADVPLNRPIHLVHQKPSPKVTHVVHHHTTPTNAHGIRHNPTPMAAYERHERRAPTTVHTVRQSQPPGHRVIKNPLTTAAGTRIPESASNIHRLVTTKPNAHKAREQKEGISGVQHHATATGTKIPDAATNIKRVISTPTTTARVAPVVSAEKKTLTQQGKSVAAESSTREHGQSFISENVIVTGRKVITPQADRMRSQRSAPKAATPATVGTANKLSGNVIIWQRKT